MSRVIFLCSGNTCRSPIASGLAKQVFGPSHLIESAGAETISGAPIAPNAIQAVKDLGADIVGQETRDLSGIDLTTFDLIVVFRPSSAESVVMPAEVRVEYLDVKDPYGSPLDQYICVAKRIQRGVRRLYVIDALRRVEAEGGAANSHLAGIFNRAAKECEKEIATFVREDLGESVSQKATLGQLGDRIAAKSGPSPQLSDLAEEVKRANRVWIEIKHLSDPPVNNLRKGLEAIRDVFGLLETTIHHE